MTASHKQRQQKSAEYKALKTNGCARPDSAKRKPRPTAALAVLKTDNQHCLICAEILARSNLGTYPA
jgi:hypothetical protein